MIAHGELSFYACFKFSRQRPKLESFRRDAVSFSPFFQPVRVLRLAFPGWPVSYLSCSKRAGHECLALRNFDTEPHSSHCYEGYSDNRLESVANAHTAADLHVRPVS